MHEDLLVGFGKFGKIEDEWFVRTHQTGLGSEPGCLFLMYENSNIAE